MKQDIIEQKLNIHFNNDVNPKLKKKHIDSIKRYSLSDSSIIKRFLLDEELSSKEEEYAYNLSNSITEAIKVSRIPFDLFLYHGGSTDMFDLRNGNLYINNLLLEEGSIFKTDIFLSTSLDKNIASSFMKKNKSNEKVLLEIYLPQNSNAIWLNSISLYKKEKEVLLMDQTKFMVTDYKKLEDYHFIKVKVIK